MDGFSFNGIHCSEFGIGYIPSPANRMLDEPQYNQIEKNVTGCAGGYYYGNNVEIREFELECYVESISTETFERILQWIHRDTKGRLIFDDRPYVYYDVVPWKKPQGKIYPTGNDNQLGMESTLFSGTITFYFKAYDPFGKMTHVFYDGQDADGAYIGTGILPQDEMPPMIEAHVGDYLVYNPGTEQANTVIRIAGKAPEGVVIRNYTNGTVCTLLSLPSGDDYLEIDSEAGSIKQLPSSPDEFAFEYHDLGYITLSPCTPYQRNITISYTSGSNVISNQVGLFTGNWGGRYLRLDGNWVRIIRVQDPWHAVINIQMKNTGAESTMAATMNQISIEGNNVELTKFELDYTPRVR